MKQSAVEYLIRNLEILNLIKDGDLENELFRQIELEAKEMEKQQITSIIKDIITESYSQGRIDAISDNPYATDGNNYYEIEFLNFPTNNIIDKWLGENGSPEIKKQVEDKAKELFEQERMYSDEEVLAFGKSCFYKGFEKAKNDDANCYTAFREETISLVEQFKNK